MSDKPLTFRFNGTEVVPAAFGPGDLDETRRLHASLSLGPDAPTVGFPDFHHFSQIAMIEEQMWMCGRERRRLRRKALRDGTFRPLRRQMHHTGEVAILRGWLPPVGVWYAGDPVK